jgi:ribosomal-protein-alanine N-acetyltransferase
MSALFASAGGAADGPAELTAMRAVDVDSVMAIETGVYPFPWTRGNFIDSLAAGYIAQLLREGRSGPLLGYYIALAGVDEMHLLNITVAPAHQRQGHARFMLSDLIEQSRRRQARRIWLEVRASNAVALAIYRHCGFAEQGLRAGYYPAPHGMRESAVVMSLDIEAAEDAGDALD